MFARVACLVLLAGCGSGGGGQRAPEGSSRGSSRKAQAIVDRAVEATGGRARLEAIRGYRLEGTEFILGSMGEKEANEAYVGSQLEKTEEFRLPGKWRMETSAFNLVLTVLGGPDEVFTGTSGASVQIEGEPATSLWLRTRVKAAIVLPHLLDGRARTHASVDGHPAVRVAYGEHEVVYVFDADSGRMRQALLPSYDQRVSDWHTERIDLSDWRPAGALWAAHRLETSLGSWPRSRLTVRRVVWNPEGDIAAPEKTPAIDAHDLKVTLFVEEEPAAEIVAHSFKGTLEELEAWIPGPITIGFPGAPKRGARLEAWIHAPKQDGARREAYQFAFYRYQGRLEGCLWLIPRVLVHARLLGTTSIGGPRIVIDKWDADKRTCRARVGVPVKE